ncbi:MAG TPA: hypothetical protein P5186_06615 [Candidatus Paceibacterota bacterium]|nr:hypothetical protein [Candidatus Paceibacterota bacterium]HSA00407.1 hypothetical protein [Candidatus Paceibacterota bacterium]
MSLSWTILPFYITGKEQAKISGQVERQPMSFRIEAGTNVLRWAYGKNALNSQGEHGLIQNQTLEAWSAVKR